MLDINSLTLEERLERLWDSLASNPRAIPLTNAQRDELDHRLDDLDREGPIGLPSEDFVRRIGDPNA
jgi:putative addiction module component (TIGR02574 family)